MSFDRRELFARMDPATKQRTFANWRATIPFSDEQIATACEQEAAVFQGHGHDFMAEKWLRAAQYARDGHLSNWVVSGVMGRLVEQCGICGKKALYRYGSSGRCRVHRLIASTHVAARRERLARDSADFDRELKMRTSVAIQRDSLRHCKHPHR